MGVHTSTHTTLHFGPQSQHETRLQREAEECTWLLEGALSEFPSYEPGNGSGNCLDMQPTLNRAQK